MNEKKLLFKVTVRYTDFIFINPDEAVSFAVSAKQHENEPTNVSIEIIEED